MNVKSRTFYFYCFIAVLLLPLVQVHGDSQCPNNTVKNSEIQERLKEINQNDQCYQYDASAQGNPLDDGEIGTVTKRWIKRSLDNTANTHSDKPYPVTEGMQPWVLLQQDLMLFKLNKGVYEILQKLSSDSDANNFVTRDDALSTISNEIMSLDGMDEAFSERYIEKIKEYIESDQVYIVTDTTLANLSLAGYSEVADALTMIEGKELDIDSLKLIVGAITHEENSQIKKTAENEKEAKNSEAEKNAEKEKKSIKLKEAEISVDLRSEISEIAKTDDDAKSLLKKIADLPGKFIGLFKDKKPQEEVLPEDVAEPDPKEVEKLIDDLLKREIKKRQENVDAFTKKNNKKKADVEKLAIAKLQNLYHQEQDRRQYNIKVKEINASINTDSKSAGSESEPALLDRKSITKKVIANSVSVKWYRLSIEKDYEAKFPELNDDFLTCAEHLVGVYYPSRNAVESAVLEMIAALNDAFSEKDTDDEKSASSPKFDCQIETSKSKISEPDANKTAKAIAQVALKPFYSGGLSPVTLNVVPSCTECSLPMSGTNYGFYPYWQASTIYAESGLPQTNPGAINFSVFNRMAYFALPIDHTGKFIDMLHWQRPNLLKEFVSTLAQYNVARDIVLYAPSWHLWGAYDSQSQTVNFDNPEKIESVVKKIAASHYLELTKLNGSVADYGGLSGVTLYFDNYKKVSDSTVIKIYVNELHKLIQEDKKETNLEISLMLGIKGLRDERSELDVGKKITDINKSYFKELEPIFLSTTNEDHISKNVSKIEGGSLDEVDEKIETIDRDQIPVKRILVFLKEATSDYKKRLRLQIENEFSGEMRIDAQIKIIPILGRLALKEYSNKPHHQYVDDLSYLKYNFGGIGIWNLPLTGYTDGEMDDVNTQMSVLNHVLKLKFNKSQKDYMQYDRLGWVGSAFQYASSKTGISICGYICPNRQYTLPVFLFLLSANIVVFVLWRTNCAFRKKIDSLFPLFPMIKLSVFVLFFGVIGCDPEVQPYSNMMIGVFFAGVIGFIAFKIFTSSIAQESR